MKNGGNITYIRFRGVKLIEFNTTKMTYEIVNQETPESWEYELVKKFNWTEKWINKLSNKSNEDPKKVHEKIDKIPFTYAGMTKDHSAIVEEKKKKYGYFEKRIR